MISEADRNAQASAMTTQAAGNWNNHNRASVKNDRFGSSAMEPEHDMGKYEPSDDENKATYSSMAKQCCISSPTFGADTQRSSPEIGVLDNDHDDMMLMVNSLLPL